MSNYLSFILEISELFILSKSEAHWCPWLVLYIRQWFIPWCSHGLQGWRHISTSHYLSFNWPVFTVLWTICLGIIDTLVLNLIYFNLGVLIKEFLDLHVTSSNSNLYCISFFNLNSHSLWSEIVKTLRLPLEENLESVSIMMRVDKVTKNSVNGAVQVGDVNHC